MKAWVALAAAPLLACGGGTAARTYGVEDLLRSEDFGAVAFDPNDRWLVFERQGSFLSMSRFDMLARAGVLRSRLYRVDLRSPWRAVPLLADPRPGAILYGFSPKGTNLAIGRLSGERWQLGIMTMATGAVRWFDVAPDYSPFHASLRWISEERLVTLADPTGERPWWLRTDSLPADRLAARWAATRSGLSAAVTAIGSGRYRGVGDRRPQNRLMLVDVLSGAASVLAAGPFLSLDLAPDRTRLALIEQGNTAPLPKDRPVGQIDVPYRRLVALYDLRRRTLWRPCADCDVQDAVRWSPDSGDLAFVARRGEEDWPAARLFWLDVAHRSLFRLAATGIAPAVTELGDGSARTAFAWRGRDLLLFGRPAADKAARADWYLLRETRSARSLTAALDRIGGSLVPVRGCAAAVTAAKGIWCLDGVRPRRIGGVSARIANGVVSTVRGEANGATGAGRIERVDVSPSGRMKVTRTMAADGTKALSIAYAGRTAVVDRVNFHLRGVEPAIDRRLSYRLPNGGRATGWLYVPPGAPAGGKYPLVVIPYPGQVFGDEPPAGQELASARFHANAQILAGRGYAVLLPSLPSTAAVSDRIPGFVEELDRAVDAAVDTGAVDSARIALWGHSYGAYAAAMIATRRCRYASVITSAGVYDLGAVPGTFGPTLRLAPERAVPIGLQFAWAETGQAKLGLPPWADPQAYIAASPVYRADRIATPMLIIAADRDPSPLQQAEQLFSALFRQNRDAQLVTYWGEGHVVGSPANLRDLYERVFAWLAETMKRPRRQVCAEPPSPPSGLARRAPNVPPG